MLVAETVTSSATGLVGDGVAEEGSWYLDCVKRGRGPAAWEVEVKVLTVDDVVAYRAMAGVGVAMAKS